MDQIKIGRFIAEKRKEQKMTQVQLAEKLGITDRAVSKWETGSVDKAALTNQTEIQTQHKQFRSHDLSVVRAPK